TIAVPAGRTAFRVIGNGCVLLLYGLVGSSTTWLRPPGVSERARGSGDDAHAPRRKRVSHPRSQGHPTSGPLRRPPCPRRPRPRSSVRPTSRPERLRWRARDARLCTPTSAWRQTVLASSYGGGRIRTCEG